MNSPLKLPTQHVLDKCLDMIRKSTHCTDAVIIMLDARTNECKVGTMRGDINRMTDILGQTAVALNKQRKNTGGIISLN